MLTSASGTKAWLNESSLCTRTRARAPASTRTRARAGSNGLNISLTSRDSITSGSSGIGIGVGIRGGSNKSDGYEACRVVVVVDDVVAVGVVADVVVVVDRGLESHG